MQQPKQSTDLKKDKEQKPEKGRRRKFSGRQGSSMKMESAGFMTNHYWSVLVLWNIRLATQFTPGDQGSSVIKQQSIFLQENLSLPSLLQWFLTQGYWTWRHRWTIKVETASLSPLWQLQFWLQSWEKLQALKQDVSSFSRSHALKSIYRQTPVLVSCPLMLLFRHKIFVS